MVYPQRINKCTCITLSDGRDSSLRSEYQRVPLSLVFLGIPLRYDRKRRVHIVPLPFRENNPPRPVILRERPLRPKNLPTSIKRFSTEFSLSDGRDSSLRSE
jgi:hypothetical protein